MPRAASAVASAAWVKALLFSDTSSPAVALHARSSILNELRHYSFDKFVSEYQKGYTAGTEEWTEREELFQNNMDRLVQFHTGPEQSWQEGVTRFMDFTEEEYRSMLGYKGSASRVGRKAGAISLYRRRRDTQMPGAINLVENRTLTGLVRDQGMCGSCWAEAATAVLEGHMEVNTVMMDRMAAVQAVPTLSSQTMVSCTANPRNCGGTGGCSGATVELGYDMVQAHGIPLASVWPYTSGGGGTPQCNNNVFSKMRLGITGYTVLPQNKFNPLKEALVDSNGPVAVSVDATNWMMYRAGVFSDTAHGSKGDFQVNHAVTLVGYKEGAGNQMGYWMIKNSWGEFWGEKGFIRLEMKQNEEEHCGMDTKTHDGLACDGDPDTAWVCGTCGVLYDSVLPQGVHLVEEGQ